MLQRVQATRGLDMHMRCIEMHVVGFLEIQHQANQMHGQFKHMSKLMKMTIAKGISN